MHTCALYIKWVRISHPTPQPSFGNACPILIGLPDTWMLGFHSTPTPASSRKCSWEWPVLQASIPSSVSFLHSGHTQPPANSATPPFTCTVSCFERLVVGPPQKSRGMGRVGCCWVPSTSPLRLCASSSKNNLSWGHACSFKGRTLWSESSCPWRGEEHLGV